MRTTVDLEEDVLAAAKELAAARRIPMGRLISDLLRTAMAPKRRPDQIRNGVPLLPATPGRGPVTMSLVNRLRDDSGN